MFNTLYGKLIGSEAPPPPRIPLRAGRLSMIYEDGTLQEIRLGGAVIVRRIYLGVRTASWGTLPPRLADVEISATEHAFRISFTATHQGAGIDFAWRGTLIGMADDTVMFTVEGQANADFHSNRLGICVLHPREAAGQSARITHPDGTRTDMPFPSLIDPQVSFFKAVRAITTFPAPGVEAEVRMEGDVWETEDQRQWGDASYKSFNLGKGAAKPWTIAAGESVTQSITVRVAGAWAPPATAAVPTPAPVQVHFGAPVPLPALGSVHRSPGPFTPTQAARLARLNPAHLRVDLPADADLPARLASAWAEAERLACDLELGLHFGPEPLADAIGPVQRALAAVPVRGRILVYRAGEAATAAETVQQVRAAIGTIDGVRVGGGTHGPFVDVNRNRPAPGAYQAAAWHFSPQIHGTDAALHMDTPSTLPDIVATARAFLGEAEIAFSPVMLRSGWMPLDLTLGPDDGAGLPIFVDPRQGALFAAAWALAMIAGAAHGGVDSLTLYAAVGPTGLIEDDQPQLPPDRFPSQPGVVFPAYHVLADVGALPKAARRQPGVQPLVADQPFKVVGLVFTEGDRQTVLLANLTAEPQTAVLAGLDVTQAWRLRLLDANTFEQAAHDPEGFASAGEAAHFADGAASISLPPYAYARLTQAGS